MSFLLKIVEGPNKGAEIALVEGLCITIGKADTCDIILADPTLPDTPLQIEAAADGVSLEAPGEGRRHLEIANVETFGSTSFAVGPAETAWPPLVWPKKDEPKEEAAAVPVPEAEAPVEEKVDEKKPETRQGGAGRIIAAIAVLILILILCALGWFFRERIVAVLSPGGQGEGDAAVSAVDSPEARFDVVVAKYSLEKREENGVVTLAGDFATRAERLEATAAVYAAQPGAELDFADEESLKSAVEETLALVGEKELSVAAVTNRVAALAGHARNLKAALEAVASDVPKIANVDCSAVTAAEQPLTPEERKAQERREASRKSRRVDFPVCGIVTNPYPCLVMRDGMRIMEGAAIGDSVVVKIEADKVTITNSSGRVVWKP